MSDTKTLFSTESVYGPDQNLPIDESNNKLMVIRSRNEMIEFNFCGAFEYAVVVYDGETGAELTQRGTFKEYRTDYPLLLLTPGKPIILSAWVKLTRTFVGGVKWQQMTAAPTVVEDEHGVVVSVACWELTSNDTSEPVEGECIRITRLLVPASPSAPPEHAPAGPAASETQHPLGLVTGGSSNPPIVETTTSETPCVTTAPSAPVEPTSAEPTPVEPTSTQPAPAPAEPAPAKPAPAEPAPSEPASAGTEVESQHSLVRSDSELSGSALEVPQYVVPADVKARVIAPASIVDPSYVLKRPMTVKMTSIGALRDERPPFLFIGGVKEQLRGAGVQFVDSAAEVVVVVKVLPIGGLSADECRGLIADEDRGTRSILIILRYNETSKVSSLLDLDPEALRKAINEFDEVMAVGVNATHFKWRSDRHANKLAEPLLRVLAWFCR